MYGRLDPPGGDWPPEPWGELATLAYNAARPLTHCGDAAEDISQTAMARLLYRIRRLGSPAHSHSYVYMIAVNLAYDLARRQSRFPEARLRTEALRAPPVESPDDGWTGLSSVVGFRELSPKQREVLVLLYEYGFTEQEAARKLGVDRETVRTHRKRALGLLRRRHVNDGAGGT